MTKQDLINSLVQEGLSQTKAEAKATINFIFNSITQTSVSGSEVSLQGFGKFSTATQAGRNGTAPDGTAWTSKTKQIPKFKASTVLKNAVA